MAALGVTPSPTAVGEGWGGGSTWRGHGEKLPPLPYGHLPRWDGGEIDPSKVILLSVTPGWRPSLDGAGDGNFRVLARLDLHPLRPTRIAADEDCRQ